MAVGLSEISAILRGVVRDNDVDLTPDTRFEDLTGWDSMDLVTVVVEVECRYELQFDLADIDRLVTLGDLARIIVAKQALAAA